MRGLSSARQQKCKVDRTSQGEEAGILVITREYSESGSFVEQQSDSADNGFEGKRLPR